MKKRGEDDELKWSEPELSREVPVGRKPSGVEQVLAAGGVIIAMDVAALIAEKLGS